MRTVVIANPKAAAGKVRREWPSHERALGDAFGVVETQFTAAPGHATELARAAVASGAERVIAVGGDGTINEVVNGLLADGAPSRVQFGVFPAGTGGDFARSVGLSAVDLRRALRELVAVRCDVGRVTVRGPTGDVQRHFINVASLGATGLIVKKVNATTKRLGGKASFALGTLRGLAAHRNERMRVRVDDEFEEELVVNSVAAANGRCFGGGMKIAPGALLNDGALQVVILGDISVGTFVRYSGRLYDGTHLSLPEVRSLSGRRITVTPVGGDAPFVEADGELVGSGSATFECIPAALELLVAPGAEAVGGRRPSGTAAARPSRA